MKYNSKKKKKLKENLNRTKNLNRIFAPRANKQVSATSH